MKKKILIFFPHNFTLMSDGCHIRFKQILDYLIDNDFEIDIISYKKFDKYEWTGLEVLVGVNLHLINSSKLFVNNGIFSRILKKIFRTGIYWYDYSLISKVKEIIKKKKFDYYLGSYATWGYLPLIIKKENSKIKTICDTQDLLALQNEELSVKQRSKFFYYELLGLKNFDFLINISEFENVLFSRFLNNRNILLPICFETQKKLENNAEKEYDFIFIGSNNVHNQKGIIWFLEEVFSKIDGRKLAIAGNICNSISKYANENVCLLGRVEKLEDVYRKSKVAICPMLSGTGQKVKVIEALSFGVPVIASEIVKDGLQSGYENSCFLARNKDEFIKLLNKVEQITLKNSVFEYFNKNYSKEKFDKTLHIVFDKGD